MIAHNSPIDCTIGCRVVFREEPSRRRVGASMTRAQIRMMGRWNQGSGGAAHWESKMSSAHEPSQLLEPSNLLEPLDLTERQLDFLSPSAGSDVTGASQRGFTRTNNSKFIPRPARGHARSPLKAILMIAGAFACFGAGMAMPQLQKFTFDDVKSWQTIGTATSPSSTPVADAAVKPDASKLAGSKLSPDRSAPDVGQSVP